MPPPAAGRQTMPLKPAQAPGGGAGAPPVPKATVKLKQQTQPLGQPPAPVGVSSAPTKPGSGRPGVAPLPVKKEEPMVIGFAVVALVLSLCVLVVEIWTGFKVSENFPDDPAKPQTRTEWKWNQ